MSKNLRGSWNLETHTVNGISQIEFIEELAILDDCISESTTSNEYIDVSNEHRSSQVWTFDKNKSLRTEIQDFEKEFIGLPQRDCDTEDPNPVFAIRDTSMTFSFEWDLKDDNSNLDISSLGSFHINHLDDSELSLALDDSNVIIMEFIKE